MSRMLSRSKPTPRKKLKIKIPAIELLTTPIDVDSTNFVSQEEIERLLQTLADNFEVNNYPMRVRAIGPLEDRGDVAASGQGGFLPHPFNDDVFYANISEKGLPRYFEFESSWRAETQEDLANDQPDQPARSSEP
jgi:hypothetical protein